MKPNEINEAIAEHLGIQHCHGWWCDNCREEVPGINVTFHKFHDARAGGCGGLVGDKPVPNYSGDLNAMHEAEKMIRPPNQENWITWLVYAERILPGICGERITTHATAAQRAEAFLRTVSKWKEAE